jgi:nitrate reductase NapE component
VGIAGGSAAGGRRRSPMSDVAYVVLTVALFGLLALALRGLERL